MLKSKSFIIFLGLAILLVAGYVLAATQLYLNSVYAHNPGNQTVGVPFDVSAATVWQIYGSQRHRVWVNVKHEVGGSSEWCNKQEIVDLPTPPALSRNITTTTWATFNISSAGTYTHTATSYLDDMDSFASAGPKSNTSSSFQVSDP